MTTTDNVRAETEEVDLDQHSPEFAKDPYAVYREMHQRCPIARSPHHGGFWVFSDYASVYEASRDDDLFNSAPSIGLPPVDSPFPMLPIETDPPLTQQLRAITLKQLSPASAAKLMPLAREMATMLIDKFIEIGECDLSAELATPLPARLTLAMMGMDQERYLDWVHWVHTVMHGRSQDPEASSGAVAELFGELTKHMTIRKEQGFGDDLLSHIMQGTVGGRPLEEWEQLMYSFLMIMAGMDTTAGLIGNAVVRLAHDSELRRRLTADPSLLSAAVEEFLRLDTPSQGLARTVSRDAEFHGHQLKKGDRVLLLWAAANVDANTFEKPNDFVLNRPNNRHMTFGVGSHRCIGSNLARMMFTVVLEEILTRIPDYTLAGEPVRFADAGEIYGPHRLPITFTPGRRLAKDQPVIR
jgi:cytochrome P450